MNKPLVSQRGRKPLPGGKATLNCFITSGQAAMLEQAAFESKREKSGIVREALDEFLPIFFARIRRLKQHPAMEESTEVLEVA